MRSHDGGELRDMQLSAGEPHPQAITHGFSFFQSVRMHDYGLYWRELRVVPLYQMQQLVCGAFA